MKLGGQVKISVQLLYLFFESRAPFDIVMAKFFKNNRIGSHDRREIAEFSYGIFRSFEKLKFLASNITANFGRFYTLTFLKTCKNMSEAEIGEIFSGKQYDPAKLTDFEKKFLNS